MFPLNRIVAFLGPYIAIASGAIASWLLLHVHVLGTFHFGHDQVASAIAQGLVFLVSTAVVWLGHNKWLEGFQRWESGLFGSGQPTAAGPQGGDFTDSAQVDSPLDPPAAPRGRRKPVGS